MRRVSRPAARYTGAPGQQAAGFQAPATPQAQHAIQNGGPGVPNPGYTAMAGLLSDPSYLAATAQGQRQIGLGQGQYTYLTGNTFDANGRIIPGATTGRLGAEYGFDANGNIDPNNPYSRAALLQQSYKNQQTGNTNSYAAAGHYYSGALQNAQDETTRRYNIGYDQLQRGYGDASMGALQGLLGAYTGAAGGVDQGAFAALLNKLGGK